MSTVYRVRYRKADFEIEIESSDKAFVDSKLAELRILESPKPKEEIRGEGGHSRRKPPKNRNEASVPESALNIPQIVDRINTSDEHSLIEAHVLRNSARLPRILMCLYFIKDDADPCLTTGQIETLTDQLKIKISKQNVGATIKENQQYFSADKVRKTGVIVRYKLNRKGIEAFEGVLKNSAK